MQVQFRYTWNTCKVLYMNIKINIKTYHNQIHHQTRPAQDQYQHVPHNMKLHIPDGFEDIYTRISSLEHKNELKR